MDNRVFISFSAKDRVYADMVLNYLENKFDIKCWICYRDLVEGSVFSEDINNAIKSCSCLVLLRSRSSKEAEDAKNELGIAETYNKTVIFYTIDDFELEDIFEHDNKKKHWIDIIDCHKKELYDLALSVCKIVGDEIHIQISIVLEVIASIGNGATPELIQKLVDEGYRLTQLYKKRPESFKKKYESLSSFEKTYSDFCNEIQRIIAEHNGDIANNHTMALKLLNDMLNELNEYNCDGAFRKIITANNN